jgi:hypothetical protein
VKGVVLHADIIISVADVPLIGVNLRAAIAGIKTMLDYGMMEAWDAKIRSYALEDEGREALDLEDGEELIYTTFASLYTGRGSTAIWSQCYLHLTNFRLILLRKKPRTILLELQLRHLSKVSVTRDMYFWTKKKMLTITHSRNTKEKGEIKIFSDDIDELASKIRDTMATIPVTLTTRR